MSADGELYIGEECRDTFYDNINKVFGKDNWKFDLSDYSDCWDMRLFPKLAPVDILDKETDVKIGTAVISSKFEVDGDDLGREIKAVPDDIEITEETKNDK